jgi:hypothetical protein
VGIVCTAHAFGAGVTVEYFHEKGWDGRTRISKRARRKTRCKVFYADTSTSSKQDTGIYFTLTPTGTEAIPSQSPSSTRTASP